MLKLNKLQLRGYKGIREATIEFQLLNVLIGANGAGKSSLISFFRLLNEMMGERLQQFIAMHGRAHSLLFHGPKRTPQLEASLEFETDAGVNIYDMRLFHVDGDTLCFASESLQFCRLNSGKLAAPESLGAGHFETRMRDPANLARPNVKVFRHLLNTCRVYHFHDTSSTARVRQACYVGDESLLMYDAGNLAAFLYGLKQLDDDHVYRRIVGTIQLITPFFDDFDLVPTGPGGKDLFLNWREKGSDQLFGPHQLSDGTLRAMCLITLLLQPTDRLPLLLIVDEPELGLHPYAMNIIGGLFRSAALHSQVLISTQSSSFVDQFEPDEIIVVDRTEEGSTFTRPDPQKLDAWLEDYSLGQVWEKNVFAGGPH